MAPSRRKKLARSVQRHGGRRVRHQEHRPIYGLLYCAKGNATLLVPFGNLLMEATGTWTTVLYTMAAILILKPLRRRLAEGDARTAPLPAAPSVAV